MKPGRLTWLLLALVATAAVAAFGDAQEAPATALPLAAERHVAIRILLPRQYVPAPAGDPFATQLPSAPVQAAPAERPDAVPSAPTFSAAPNWRVLGKQKSIDESEGWTVFLARGEETCVVRTGDTLDERYRVLAIIPPTLTLQHLKNKTKHTLDIGDARE